ncbi:AIP3-domain-containing protein, partial [Fistulina hepatica ATCC 64428]
QPAVESAVTRLLVSIKSLLETLTQWSRLQATETQVSDVYVRLGNEFNAAVYAFEQFKIDMSELKSVPDELRMVLEQCLAEDASTENLDIYLPSVRQIITSLLQGLRNKQEIYRRLTGTRASKTRRSQQPSSDRRSDHAAVASSSRRSTASSRRMVSSPPPQSEEQFVGGFSPSLHARDISRDDVTPSEVPQQQQARRTTVNLQDARPAPEPEPVPQPSPPPPAPTVQAVPASIKRYSLVDKPTPPAPPPVVIEPAEPVEPELPDPPPAQLDSSTPAMARSLAALTKSENLERRASKRFSTYNISKMTASPRDKSAGRNPNRRSLAVGTTLTAGELAVLTEVDDEEAAATPVASQSYSRSRTATPDGSLVPPLPTTPVQTADHGLPATNGVREPTASPSPVPEKLTVFLQLAREIKKVQIDRELTFASLRMLFVDKFSYNPGQENFPAIYIRDPSSGVQYELEDVEEVREKCLLSLNIEPLDQIKQHIDMQIASLSSDLRELRSAVVVNQRPAQQLLPIMSSPLAESTPTAARPSDRQFQHVARRLSRFVGDSSSFSFTDTPVPSGVIPQAASQSLQPQMTGASVMSDYTNRVVSDLKTQFDEIQNLRRDLGVMRQLYTEFMKQTKESLGNLRAQTQNVKQLASTGVGGARAYIDTGKKNLDARSQGVLTEMEKLQDAVEGVKEDVVRRNAMPKAMYWKNIKKDVDGLTEKLTSLKEHINTIRPMWKKTWAEELQNIVEEQQFLTHQEELLGDLLEDHRAVVDMYAHMDKIISMRGPGSGRGSRGRGFFKPPPLDEGHNGLSTVMLEIRGAHIDPERRMKAIEANQKSRQMELASRPDELQAELTEFIGQKKLRMTGGAEEIERLRQKKNDATLKAMFS